jgi:hypothetical protein
VSPRVFGGAGGQPAHSLHKECRAGGIIISTSSTGGLFVAGGFAMFFSILGTAFLLLGPAPCPAEAPLYREP